MYEVSELFSILLVTLQNLSYLEEKEIQKKDYSSKGICASTSWKY